MLKRLSSKAAASEKARRTVLMYGEPLNDARTKLGAVSIFWKESWWVVQTSLDAAELASEPRISKYDVGDSALPP